MYISSNETTEANLETKLDMVPVNGTAHGCSCYHKAYKLLLYRVQ